MCSHHDLKEYQIAHTLLFIFLHIDPWDKNSILWKVKCDTINPWNARIKKALCYIGCHLKTDLFEKSRFTSRMNGYGEVMQREQPVWEQVWTGNLYDLIYICLYQHSILELISVEWGNYCHFNRSPKGNKWLTLKSKKADLSNLWLIYFTW